MDKRANLKILAEIIGDLVKDSRNVSFVDDLIARIEKVSPISPGVSHAIVKSVQEYCVKDILKVQAEGFYFDFPVSEIKKQLILDYIKMEESRRRDDFEQYSLHLYQQLECIVNYYFLKSEGIRARVLKDACTQSKVFMLGDRNEYLDKEGDIINRNWGFLNRYRVVLYYLYYKKNIVWEPFKEMHNMAHTILSLRNRIHRESPLTITQEQMINKVEGKEYKYYYKFGGFLVDFIETITNNVSQLNIKIETKKTTNLKNPTFNDDPRNAEALRKAREQIKE